MQHLFDESGRAYFLEGVQPYGIVTARFDNLPFMDALNLILKPAMMAVETAEAVVIKPRPVEKAEEASGPVSVEVPIRNLDTSAAVELLNGLYPPVGPRPVDFGPVAASNRIFLRGVQNEVSQAVQTLMKADIEIEHVVIEVLVVEFSSGALEELGTKLKGYNDGKYGDMGVDFGNIGGDIITFSRLTEEGVLASASNLTRFNAVVNMMVSNNKARLISRPHISTLSGKQARINIASDRYVIVDDAEGRASSTSITAGVILDIMPIVIADGTLRMKINVEDSQFSDVNIANVSTEVKKNTAETVMHVEDGQTIVIGGLILNRRAWANTGFPFLRHIPVLNLLFSNEEDVVEEREVSIYVTPHIWKPSMFSPLINPDALTDKDKSIIQKMK